jgi:outer membrane lipoprotein-sorting protein
MKGSVKTMTRLKMKSALVASMAALVAVGTATIAISQTTGGEKLTRTEIFQRAQDAYASLSSYSDEGKTVATLNGMTFTTTFIIRLARPNLYRIKWEQPTPFFTNGGVVWSAGDGDFIILGNLAVRKEANQEMALASASGVSGGAAATIPLTFFKMNWINNPLLNSANEKQQADEKVSEVDCYVFTSEPRKGTTRTLWIGKEDFLIHQVQTVTSPEAMQVALDQAAKVTGVPAQISPQGGVTSIETHSNIVLNKRFLLTDFER